MNKKLALARTGNADKRVQASRRAFLKSVGYASLALPFYRLLEQSALGAVSAAPPLRFVGIQHGHGRSDAYWRPKAGFNISYQHSSLSVFDDAATYGTSFRDKLLVVDDIDYQVVSESGVGAHECCPAIFTGSRLHGVDVLPEGPSLDQYLARTMGLGDSTPYPTVNVGHFGVLSYGNGGAPMPYISHPNHLFDIYFANLIPPSDAAAKAAYEAKRVRGLSVLDYVTSSLNQLSSRLGPIEKAKLDQHLTAMREIEKRLNASNAPTNACQVPGQPDPELLPSGYDPTIFYDPYGDHINQLFTELLAQILACDLSRFVTWGMLDAGKLIADDPAAYVSPNLAGSLDWHNDIAHRYSGNEMPNAEEAATQIGLAHVTRYYYSHIARFMQLLKAADGLDNTLIMATSEIGDPAGHSVSNLPIIIAGGCNGALTMGRHVRLSKVCNENSGICTFNPHNQVLVSVARAFGVNIDKFGYANDPQTTMGPHPGL